jgi:hypothetical protein
MIDAAPTSSRSRCVQKLGRVTRLWPGVGEIHDVTARREALAACPKPRARVIDLAFNSTKHDICGPVDILGGAYSEKERKRAKKKLAQTGGDPNDALKKAREEIARAGMRAKAAASAKAKLTEAKAPELKTSAGELALTPGQEKALRRYGIPFDGETTKAKATKLIGFEKLCEAKGWCSYRQRDFLITWIGIKKDQRVIPAAKGARLIDLWKQAGKQRFLTRDEIRAVIGADR